ncbi:MAG: NAD(P)-dependent oxidoreductase [Chloroflexota bacterium]|nr:NAD(P)-dependent oxidoreductase [Chloroflexota bacterium]
MSTPLLVLITGATGRIGAHLTRMLVAAGHQVRALAVPNDPRINVVAGPNAQVVIGRLEDPQAVRQAVAGVDAVYHLAGALTSRGNTDEEFFDANLRGTFNLLMAIRSRAPHIQRLVYASSDAVYWPGGHAGSQFLPVDETHPVLTGSIYGATKAAAEQLCLAFWRGYAIPTTVLRFGATADAQELIDPSSVFARWLFVESSLRHLTAGGPPPDAQAADLLSALQRHETRSGQVLILEDLTGRPEIRQWADARDIAAGCAQVLTSPAGVGEIFNLGGVSPHGADELAHYLAEKLNRPWVTIRTAAARAPWYISSAKARAVLGYAPNWSVFDMVDDALAKAQAASSGRGFMQAGGPPDAVAPNLG